MVVLADALQCNQTLEGLYLLNNQFEDEGSRALARIFNHYNRSIKYLTIGGSEIRKRGIQDFVHEL
jgi:Ran GTPase-activating protein (RanGAP) involved in mRNA processing and transport